MLVSNTDSDEGHPIIIDFIEHLVCAKHLLKIKETLSIYFINSIDKSLF